MNIHDNYGVKLHPFGCVEIIYLPTDSSVVFMQGDDADTFIDEYERMPEKMMQSFLGEYAACLDWEGKPVA